MDIGLLFIMPLLGGFIFASEFILLRYSSSRTETQRLYYKAASYGFLFSVIAAVIHFTLKTKNSGYAQFFSWVYDGYLKALLQQPKSEVLTSLEESSARIKADIVLICFYALMIGAITPIWNRILITLNNIQMVLFRSGNYLQKINLKAITDELELFIFESSLEISPIQVNLNNSKVYVGTVVETGLPEKSLRSFRMQLMMSGHRNSTDGTVVFNTFYNQVLEELTIKTDDASLLSFELIIPIENIITIGPFDFEAFEAFREQHSEQKTRKPASQINAASVTSAISTAYVAAKASSLSINDVKKIFNFIRKLF